MGRVMAAGLIVFAGTVGAAVWAVVARRADEAAQPAAVSAPTEQPET